MDRQQRREAAREGFVRNYFSLLRHIEITGEYSINEGRNLWIDPYYVGEMARLERLIKLAGGFGEISYRKGDAVRIVRSADFPHLAQQRATVVDAYENGTLMIKPLFSPTPYILAASQIERA